MKSEGIIKPVPEGLSGVKHILAVASGKGGVGKSTLSANLAVALKEAGYKVGLLDADIYGPSQSNLLGAGNERPTVSENNRINPLVSHGISFMSMAALHGSDAPVIWRAPLATKIIQNFIYGVEWGELDFLLIDLPPGTGDIQITLSQQAYLSGAVIVTTPQDVATKIAKKGLQMFETVNVPILGVIENMSGFTCSHCHEVTHIFKGGGGENLAKDLNVPFLGGIPLDPQVMESGDEGIPVIEKDKNSNSAKAFRQVAVKLGAELENLHERLGHVELTGLEPGKRGEILLHWNDQTSSLVKPYEVRLACPCAACVDEHTGEKILDPDTVALDISLDAYSPVGRYGLNIHFSDGHKTGIFKYSDLKKLGEGQNRGDEISV